MSFGSFRDFACRCGFATLLGAAACAPGAERAPEAASAGPAPGCLSPTGDDRFARARRLDVDGDGELDYVLGEAPRLAVFVTRGACLESRGFLVTDGPVAFVQIASGGYPGDMRELTVDTWLAHGDRARWRYRWSELGYRKLVRERDVILPRRPMVGSVP